MLGPGVQARLQEKAGTVLEWWARLDHAGNPRAVVLGPLGLCKANPVSRNGKRVYLVERLQLQPGALRRQSFDSSHTASRTPSRTPPTPPGPAATERGSRGAPTVDLGLDADTRDVLGNLPADVQDFLQRPFLHGDTRGVVADWYYEVTTEFTHEHLSLLLVLSADRNVTFASGFRILPRGRSPHRGHWEVECYHAPVRGRGPARS
jgi:hypothetical protein